MLYMIGPALSRFILKTNSVPLSKTNHVTALRKLRNTEKAMINFLSMLADDHKDEFPQEVVGAIAARIQVNI